MTEQEQNEKIALLLGWERADTITPQWFSPTHLATSEYRDRGFEPLPDFSQWDRFPELQEYVRGLDISTQTRVVERARSLSVERATDKLTWALLKDITPSMLRDAILWAVVGEEAEVTG